MTSTLKADDAANMRKELYDAYRQLGASEATTKHLEESNRELRARISQLEADANEMRESNVDVAKRLFDSITDKMQGEADETARKRQPYPEGMPIPVPKDQSYKSRPYTGMPQQIPPYSGITPQQIGQNYVRLDPRN